MKLKLLEFFHVLLAVSIGFLPSSVAVVSRGTAGRRILKGSSSTGKGGIKKAFKHVVRTADTLTSVYHVLLYVVSN